MQGVLSGVTVLDLSRYIAGPYCAAILGDMGAEVIRLEAPGGAEDREQGPFAATGDALRYLVLGRNKKGITLDLDKPRGQEILRQLVAKSDVILESFSPPVREKLGLAYETLRQSRPEVVLVSISGFGSGGPYSERLGFDYIAQAESGAMSYTGHPDGPPLRSQLFWVDLSTGLHAALGTVLALMQRATTGYGQWVETALMDTAVSWVGMMGAAAEAQVLGRNRPRVGNAAYYSFTDTFDARDGMVLITAISRPLWRRLVRLIGHPELLDDPRFADDYLRYVHHDDIYPLVQEWVGARTVGEVLKATNEARVPCGKINSLLEMAADPHVAARQLFRKLAVPGVGEMEHPRVAILLNGEGGRIETPAPRVGEHNEEIYRGLLGLSAEDLTRLREEGTI